MAIVTATITVDFTANYAGDHRICWRVQGSGDPYDCSTVVSCVGGGTACQAIFTADVNTTSCDGVVTFEGYVQAACEDEASVNGRLPFTVDFTPNVLCQRTEITCSRGPIESITINDGGYGYQLGDAVVITRDPGDTETTNAGITIGSVGTGIINSISGLSSAGTGYAPGDTIDIDVVVGPGCAGSGGVITVDTVGASGEILTYTLTNGGSGYTCDSFTFSNTSGGGVGANFDIVQGVDFDAEGEILTFNIAIGGVYGATPTISITTATGQSFDGDVVLRDCPGWNDLGRDCDSRLFSIAGLPVGETLAVCLTEGPTGGPDEYTTSETGCCIPEDTAGDPCVDYHLENNTGAPVEVQYTACGGVNTVVTVADATNVSICAVDGGVIDPGLANFTVTNTGSPCT